MLCFVPQLLQHVDLSPSRDFCTAQALVEQLVQCPQLRTLKCHVTYRGNHAQLESLRAAYLSESAQCLPALTSLAIRCSVRVPTKLDRVAPVLQDLELYTHDEHDTLTVESWPSSLRTLYWRCFLIRGDGSPRSLDSNAIRQLPPVHTLLVDGALQHCVPPSVRVLAVGQGEVDLKENTHLEVMFCPFDENFLETHQRGSSEIMIVADVGTHKSASRFGDWHVREPERVFVDATNSTRLPAHFILFRPPEPRALCRSLLVGDWRVDTDKVRTMADLFDRWHSPAWGALSGVSTSEPEWTSPAWRDASVLGLGSSVYCFSHPGRAVDAQCALDAFLRDHKIVACFIQRWIAAALRR